MSDQSEMFSHPMSSDFDNVTGSQASPSGHMRSGLLGGKTKENAGQGPRPASPSVRPAKAKRSTTKGIFGQNSFVSSKHEDLSFALASRYRALTDSLGSTLFTLTWSTRITPLGFSIPAQRASEPRTEDSVCIGWPTPTVQDDNQSRMSMDTANREIARKNGASILGVAAFLAGWPTTRAEDAESSGMRHSRGVADTMTAVASLAGWVSPKGRDFRCEAAASSSQERMAEHQPDLNKQVMLAGWKTPCVPNGGRISGNTADIGKHQDGTKAQIGLENEAKLSGWSTPGAYTSNESWETKQKRNDRHLATSESTSRTKGVGGTTLPIEADLGAWQTPAPGFLDMLPASAWPADPSTDSGQKPIGYLLGPNGWVIVPACGQLNAGHSRWLMGLPAIWCEAGIAAFRSLKKRKRA